MNSSDKLKKASEHFIKTSDEIWTDCINGLKNLDRIIVDSNSSIVSMTRGYLIPIVYAYWERFFKTIFCEYIRCLEMAKIELDYIDPEVIAFRFRKEMLNSASAHKIKKPEDMANLDLQDLRKHVKAFSTQLFNTLDFPQHIDWVDTESNVTFQVLEKTCKLWKINMDQIKEDVQKDGAPLYAQLKQLLDARNSIAHGEEFRKIDSKEWDNLKSFVKDLMSALQNSLYLHLAESHTVINNPSSN